MLREEQEKLKNHLVRLEAQAANDRIYYDSGLKSLKEEYDHHIAEIKSDCEKQIKEANNRADQIIHTYREDTAIAKKARREAEEYRDIQERLYKNREAVIDKLAREKIANEIQALRNDKNAEVSRIRSSCDASIECYKKMYNLQYAAKETWHSTVFLFCILWSVVQVVCSNRFRDELSMIVISIIDYVHEAAVSIVMLSVEATEISSNVSNTAMAAILYYIIMITVAILLVLFFYVIPSIILIGGSILYVKSKLFDKIMQWFMLGTGILLIAESSELIRTPPINLVYLWIVIQVVFPLVRYLIIPLLMELLPMIVNATKAGFHELHNIDSSNKRMFISTLTMLFFIILSFLILAHVASNLSNMLHP